MNSIDNIFSSKKFKRKGECLKEILDYTLQREFYDLSGERILVKIPKEVREAYFKLFANSVNRNSISRKIFLNSHIKQSIDFEGKGYSGSKVILKYFADEIDLEISSDSFYGEIVEFGLFLTHLNKNKELETDWAVGKNFSYHYGFAANHCISNILDEIQKSNIIPRINKEKLKKILSKKIDQ